MKTTVVLRYILIVLLILGSFAAGVNADRMGGTGAILSFLRPNPEEVSASALKTLMKTKNFVLINVHTPYEGEIPGTDTFIPYDQVVAYSSSLPKDKHTPVILYCRSGRMSGEALETMKKLGYTNVRELAGGMAAWKKAGGKLLDLSGITADVLPAKGVTLPVSWGDIGPTLVSLGVIDPDAFQAAVKPTSGETSILSDHSDQSVTINRSNAQFVVDMLWALGLAQQSPVYTDGPMGTEYKAEAGNFASTGGWTLGRGNALRYLNSNNILNLSEAEQEKVAAIAKTVYRPCCGNPTYFPDCNHGMAALALIELMVANHMDDADIYKYLLGFNSFWFPDTYVTTAVYFARRGVAWKNVDAKEVMGETYSSGKGAATIAANVGELPWRSGSGSACGT
ncbi:rhodanese-like domain-containing protein [Patescibacteria group bacterium]|nr:rhodanese-like domain-containing protein [Patescibacteria group bacterium]